MEQQKVVQKILLLGGEGFIGRNIAGYFSKKNACVSVGNEQSPFEQRSDVFLSAKPYEEVVHHESDVVIHLIDNKVPIDAFIKQEKNLMKNVGLKNGQHLIVFSSAVVYANPDSEYGQRKQALEKFYAEYCKENGIQLTILRLFNTYGPYQIPYRQGSLMGNLLYNGLNSIQTDINDRDAVRDFLYAGDIPRYIEQVVLNNMTGVHDIGSGALTSIAELINTLDSSILKNPLDVSYRGSKEAISSPCAKGDLIGVVTLTSLENGLQQTKKFYEDNMSIVKPYVK
ncbi:MAG: NAD-dependent epimerase/dehydratase family protein [Candidatus Moranbacteria bacterium]|nr:NAD-dependent epimerase/dehydratase family protein [Candidatus Moranbacteria bacterium]